MIQARTTTPSQTAELAKALAGVCVAGDLLLLSGSLGAGKTAFAKGFGVALGITEPITSPTFTIVQEYRGRLPMYHLDVYRLEQLIEVEDLGLGEILDGDGITLIEWGDVISPALPQEFLEVRIIHGDGDDDRKFELRYTGSAWTARRSAVESALQQWAT